MTDDDRPVFRALVDEVRDRLAADSTGHDVAHARRVFRLGVRLARAEGADPEVVGAAALTHELLRLEAEMNTETARELAAERHRFTEAFVERFEREWHGRE